jgi:hypothetical protein
MRLHHEFELAADEHLAQAGATGHWDEGGLAGVHSFYSDGGLIAARLPDWRLENGDYSGIFIYSSFHGRCFSTGAVQWRNVLFLASRHMRTALQLIGVLWRIDGPHAVRACAVLNS